MAFTNNYATSFRWWDRILGTDTKYREYRARVNASKTAMHNVSEEKRKVMEQKLMDEVEAEGDRAKAAIEASLKTVKVQ
jgi:methylsterol monooxygenase